MFGFGRLESKLGCKIGRCLSKITTLRGGFGGFGGFAPTVPEPGLFTCFPSITGAITTGLTVRLGITAGFFTASPAKLEAALAMRMGKAKAKLRICCFILIVV